MNKNPVLLTFFVHAETAAAETAVPRVVRDAAVRGAQGDHPGVTGCVSRGRRCGRG